MREQLWRWAARRAGCLLLFLLALRTSATSAATDAEERLIGWRGETYDGAKNTLDDSWVRVISWSPRVLVYHNFLSAAECEHVKRVAAPQMKRSTVVGTNGSSVQDEIRSSFGTFITRRKDPVMERISQRVALWTRTPAMNQEDMQVLRYGVGQKYGAHWDSLIDDSPRAMTVLLYLHDTVEGGESAFPKTSPEDWAEPTLPSELGPFSACAAGHVAARARKGDALLFHSILPDGNHDDRSMHTGCPVVNGTKWTATVWVHSMPFRPDVYERATGFLRGAGSAPEPGDEHPSEPGACKDLHKQCGQWASAGECGRNPTYMAASCGPSCKTCEACADDDRPCINRNRAKLGYLVVDEVEMRG